MGRESLKYLQNAREILKNIPIENDFYTNIKPVREAFGTAYLAILEAINEVLIKKGLIKKELPKSIEGYRGVLRKYLSAHDGRLMRNFEGLYDTLHIAGYYRGLIYKASIVKEAFKAAEEFIKKVE